MKQVSNRAQPCRCIVGGFKKSLNRYLITGSQADFARLADFPEFVYVYLGAIDEGSDIRLMYHEYVGSKASWFEILDSLPQFEESADSD